MAAWDELDAGLAELRSCRDANELADRACTLAMSSCGADRVALGRIRDGVWSPWRAAAATEDLAPLVPFAPVALEQLPTEREVARTGRAQVRRGHPGGRRRSSASTTDVDVIVAGVRSAGTVVGLLHVSATGTGHPVIVEAFADALSSMFALVDVRDRVRNQGLVLGTLAADLEDLRRNDPIELVAVRKLGAGGGPTTSPDGPAGSTRALLTERQLEVLDLILAGQSNAQIADRLVVAVPTVKSHVRAVLRAVGAVNRAEAVTRFSQARSHDAAD
ncbi:MAG: LuxR family transcriptional regulator [Marmoricola sp.]|nr:LuxR family transcriptional regulator [Marmoricola sp.]